MSLRPSRYVCVCVRVRVVRDAIRLVSSRTAVAALQGIVHALKEYKDRIQRAKMQIYVRRAGPNYQSGLRLIQNVCNDLEIPVQVFGPEKNMTEIIPLAIAYIEGK